MISFFLLRSYSFLVLFSWLFFFSSVYFSSHGCQGKGQDGLLEEPLREKRPLTLGAAERKAGKFDPVLLLLSSTSTVPFALSPRLCLSYGALSYYYCWLKSMTVTDTHSLLSPPSRSRVGRGSRITRRRPFAGEGQMACALGRRVGRGAGRARRARGSRRGASRARGGRTRGTGTSCR